jgi:hypothetical protein
MENNKLIPEVISCFITNLTNKPKIIRFFDYESKKENYGYIDFINFAGKVDRNHFLSQIIPEEKLNFPWLFFEEIHPLLFGIQIITKNRIQFTNLLTFKKKNNDSEIKIQPINYQSASSEYTNTILVCLHGQTELIMSDETIIETTINSSEEVEYRFCFNHELYEILKVYHRIKI